MPSVCRWQDLPGPRTRWWGLPLLREMARDYLGQAEGLRRTHGTLVRTQVVRERMLDVYDPALLRELLVEHHEALVRWERGPEVFAEVMGQSVLVAEGAGWQRLRRVLMPAFSSRRVPSYAGLMGEAAEAHLRSAAGVQDVGLLFSRITMDVMLRALFGQALGRDGAQVAADVQTLSEAGFREMFWPVTLPDWLPLPGKAAKRSALKRLRGLIRDGLANPSAGSLAAGLRQARSDHGESLSETELRDQCMVSFQAGHETSATALLWWSALLANHPAEQRCLREEVDGTLQGRAPSGQDPLPRLDASLKEAMRLYPPVAALLTRRLLRPIQLQGLALPAGLLLRFTLHTLHHDPSLWDEPERFRPQRFLPGAAPPPRGAYLPFGVGPRVCLGQHFAMQEMQLVAAQLLQRFALHPLSGDAPPVPRLRVTLRPLAPLRLELRPRQDAPAAR
ncbi:MAG: cytochrome P450 [Burkholderiales bacterium]|nr:cytochrome P450 [Burkholderiales bacterium]